MLKTIGLMLAMLPAVFFASAQSKSDWQPEEKEILRVVFAMFDGMRAADTTGYSKLFMPQARLLTVVDREAGKESLRVDELDKFFQSMASPREIVYDEPLWDMQVQIDGRLAQVWTKYAFYAGSRFSHCGVDAFQLFKDKDNRWKIFQLVDTRHFGEENCELPEKMYRSVDELRQSP